MFLFTRASRRRRVRHRLISLIDDLLFYCTCLTNSSQPTNRQATEHAHAHDKQLFHSFSRSLTLSRSLFLLRA